MYNDVKQVRLENARFLLAKHADNNQSTFAEMISRKPSYVNQIMGKNPCKIIGESIARMFEECFGLETLWMDNPHNELEYHSLSASSLSVLITAIRTVDVDFELLKNVTHSVIKALGDEVIGRDQENAFIERYYDECLYNKTIPNLRRAKQIIAA